MSSFVKWFAFWLLVLGAPAQAAISVVGTPVAPNNADNANTTAPLGGTTAANDVAVIFHGCQAVSACTEGTNPPTGYTNITSRTGGAQKLYADYKVAGVSESNPTITRATGSAGDQFFGWGIILRGVNTSTPVHASTTAAPTRTGGNLATPALTISVDNTMVCMAVVYGPGSSSTTAFGSFDPNGTGAWTQYTGLFYTSVTRVAVQAYCTLQTTAANIAAGSLAVTGGDASNVGRIIMVSFAAASVTPTFTSAPAIGTRTTSSIPINFTSDTTGTVYGARLTDGSGAPTCDQLEAQTATGGVQYASEAVTATVADTLTFSSITNGTVTDGYFCIEDGSGNDSAVAAIADMYKLPAWTSNPVKNSCTAFGASGACTYGFTLDGPGTVYVASCKLDLGDSTSVANVKAATCSASTVATANKAVTGADTITVGSSIAWPGVDTYFVGTYGAQDSALFSLTDVLLNPPTGYQTSFAVASLCTNAGCPLKEHNDAYDPNIVDGDLVTVQSVTSPSGFTVTAYTDGNLTYSDPNATAQLAKEYVYDRSAGDFHAEANTLDVYFNWEDPICSPPYVDLLGINVGAAIADVDLNIQCVDPQESTLAYAVTAGTLINGLSLSSAGVLSGTPTVEDEDGNAVTVTLTNEAELTSDFTLTTYTFTTVAVPDCVGETSSTCESLLQATNANLTLDGVAYECGPTYPDIASQDPAASTEVEPNTTLDVVAAKLCSKRAIPGVGVSIRLGL